MADAITVDELKIFVGTGLKFQCPDEDGKLWYEKIDHMYDCGDIDTVEGFFFRAEEIGLEECKPMVRPLSKITMADLDHLELHTSISSFGRNVEDYVKFVLEGKESLPRSLFLASKHYDIFNWLNKTGEDSESLAVELI